MIPRDRVKELRRVRAGDLLPHPQNWRTHPPAQRAALRGVLEEVGYADALLARELPGGALELIDGHLRAQTTPDALVPVLVVDLDDAEARTVLVTHDPLVALAETNDAALAALLDAVETESKAVEELLQGLSPAHSAALDLNDGPPGIDIPETYQVVVECRDEQDQQELYERMRGEGRRCRVLTL